MNYVKCKCFNCGIDFEKTVSEYNRTVKRGKRHFCSLPCSCKISAKENIANGKWKPRPENLKKGREQDQFSPFRWYLARARTRVKERRKENNLTLEYLKEVWDKQKGICPFTGWTMELPLGTVKWSSEANPKRASLDRIDCSKGYIQGNVRFVSVIANYARNKFDDKEVIEFCKAVTEKANGTIPEI